MNLKGILNNPATVKAIEAKTSAREDSEGLPVIEIKTTGIAEPVTILRKRPCNHAECLQSSTCKKAQTWNGWDV